MVEESGSLLLEYVNGSACTTSDGKLTTYSTRIHLVCGRGNKVGAAWESGEAADQRTSAGPVQFCTLCYIAAGSLGPEIGHVRHCRVTRNFAFIVSACAFITKIHVENFFWDLFFCLFVGDLSLTV